MPVEKKSDAKATETETQTRDRTEQRSAARRSETPQASRAQIEEAANQPKVGEGETSDVAERQSRQGDGGTGDTGQARTIAEREKDATASVFKEPSPEGRGVVDTEIEQRANPGTPGRTERKRFTQEADAYYFSELQDAYRTARAAITRLENVALGTDTRNDAFQPSQQFKSRIKRLGDALESFREEANLPG